MLFLNKCVKSILLYIAFRLSNGTGTIDRIANVWPETINPSEFNNFCAKSDVEADISQQPQRYFRLD